MTPAERGLRVVVTGAAGMLGATVARLLHERGAAVVAHAGPPGTDPSALPAGVPVIYADIGDDARVAALVRDADAVVHLAGPASAAASFGAPAAYARGHTVGTAVLLEAAARAGAGRLVHVSSAEVYGQPAANPVDEDAPTLPRSPYGAAKLGGEALVRAFCPPAGVAAAVVRPFSAYGPRSPASSLVGRLLLAALAGGPVAVSSLLPVRDYVHVEDVGTAVLAALDRLAGAEPRPVRVCNVGSGAGTSVAELARLVLAGAGRDAPIVETPARDRPAGSDVTELVADIGRARRELGWAPSVALGDGLAGALAAQRHAAG
jgi:nucleoside-diphosphate-sugar epimerase